MHTSSGRKEIMFIPASDHYANGKGSSYLPKIVIKDSAVDAVCHGLDFACGGVAELANNIQKNDIVAIQTLKGELVAAGHSLLTSNEILDADSGFAVKYS